MNTPAIIWSHTRIAVQRESIIEEKEERLTREYQELEVLVAQAEEEKEAIELLISSKAKQPYIR